MTVPTMSPLRNLKAAMGIYPIYTGSGENFYQFALPRDVIEKTFTAGGFDLVDSQTRGGVKGLKDEIYVPGLQRLFDSKWKPLKVVKAGFDLLLSPLTHHTRLYVFRAK